MATLGSIDNVVERLTQQQCKKLWEGNRDYVQFMGDSLHIGEARLLAKKQDALYLAWFDNNYSSVSL